MTLESKAPPNSDGTYLPPTPTPTPYPLPHSREAILRQNPHDRPKRSKRSPAPIVHAVAKHVRYLMMENWRDFLRRYRLASDRWRAGLEAEFPEDCFPPARPWMPARASPG
jgi:hypothetical protein